MLRFAVKAAAVPVAKLLKNAVAASQNEPANLIIDQIKVDGGPMLKRYRPRARGMAFPIHKKTSHITLILKEIDPAKKTAVKKAVKKVETPTQTAVTTGKSEGEKVQKSIPRAESEAPKKKTGHVLQRIFRRKVV